MTNIFHIVNVTDFSRAISHRGSCRHRVAKHHCIVLIGKYFTDLMMPACPSQVDHCQHNITITIYSKFILSDATFYLLYLDFSLTDAYSSVAPIAHYEDPCGSRTYSNIPASMTISGRHSINVGMSAKYADYQPTSGRCSRYIEYYEKSKCNGIVYLIM
jgi:hypothetical protein